MVMTTEERFHLMLVAMVGEDELARMVQDCEAVEHNPDDWGLDDDDDEPNTLSWEK